MTSPNNETNTDDIDSEDVTLAASDDVVAQIRAHAARVRSGEVSADEELQVWTAAEAEVTDVTEVIDVTQPAVAPELLEVTVPVETGHRYVGETDREALPNDETVVFSASGAGQPSPATPPSQPAAGSLIDGLEPPDGSATFWTADKTHGARGVDFGPRFRAGGGLPLWVWVSLVAALIIVASVGIAVAVASMGTAA